MQHLGHPIANDTQYGGGYPGPKPARMRDVVPPLQPDVRPGSDASADASAENGQPLSPAQLQKTAAESALQSGNAGGEASAGNTRNGAQVGSLSTRAAAGRRILLMREE